MSHLVPATTGYAVNTSPLITTYPFTVAMWINPSTVATRFDCYWSLSNTANATDNFFLYTGTGGNWSLEANSTLSPAVAGLAVAGKWQFVLCRAVSPTNRWISSLDPTGARTHGQDTASLSPAGINQFTVGALIDSSGTPQKGDGSFIAEFWYTNTDVQPDGLQTDNAFLSRLAHGGPFSFPHLIPQLLEYRSLRLPFNAANDPPDVYNPQKAIWTPNSIIAPHPPLPYSYKRPTEDIASIAMI